MTKSSVILRKAKEKLWDGVVYPQSGTQFICHAIVKTNPHPLKGKVGRVLKEIERRLYPQYTVEHWLQARGYIPHGLITTSKRKKIQQYRHAWIDSLIAEYEAKGD